MRSGLEIFCWRMGFGSEDSAVNWQEWKEGGWEWGIEMESWGFGGTGE